MARRYLSQHALLTDEGEHEKRKAAHGRNDANEGDCSGKVVSRMSGASRQQRTDEVLGFGARRRYGERLTFDDKVMRAKQCD